MSACPCPKHPFGCDGHPHACGCNAMSAREIIAREIAPDHPQFADDILEALTTAGYRIVGPGELDAETLERAAEEAERIGQKNCGHIGPVRVAMRLRSLKENAE